MNRDCKARQYSDQMNCQRCDLYWDVNDPDPPSCLTAYQVNHKSENRAQGTSEPPDSISLYLADPCPEDTRRLADEVAGAALDDLRNLLAAQPTPLTTLPEARKAYGDAMAFIAERGLSLEYVAFVASRKS